MTCYRPIDAYKTQAGEIVFDEKARHGETTQLKLPCGKCVGCRMQRISHWQTRITHEAQLWEDNCFITLTYGTGNLPTNASLEHRDYQLFMKRLRKAANKPIRYYMCGEYGDENGRPHYHACIFNEGFRDRTERGKSSSGELLYESKTLNQLWGHGHATVQNLNAKTAAYCAGYVLKKTLGEDAEHAYNIVTDNGEILHRQPPYSKQSNRPGIGATWLERHGKTDAFAHDSVVINGQQRSLPPYYNKILRQQNGGQLPLRNELLRYERQKLTNIKDSHPNRLKAREIVHQAKIRNLKREL